jgi:tetratricopeptide (TPR) repeat protein
MAELKTRQPVLRVLGLIGFPLLFPLALLGGGGLRSGRRAWLACLGVLLAGALVHLIFFSTGRYRVAMLPALAILAGHGAVRLADLVTERGRSLLRLWPLLLGIGLLLLAPRYDQDASRAWALHQAGTRLDQMGAVKAAAEMYEQALELNAAQGESWHNLAACKARDGKTAEAIDDYETALRFLGDHPLTLWNIAALYGKLGMDERALAYLDRALAADPSHAGARVDRGIAFFRQGRREEALAEWRRVAEANPEEASLKRTLARLLEMGIPLPEDLRRIAGSD